jgi:surfeit locus 1 family protein
MHALLRPRWVVLFLVTAVLIAAFISLGLWQWSRLGERRAHNAVVAERLVAEPVGIDDVFAAVSATLDVDSLEDTRVVATGVFDPDELVMVRNETNRGEAGFHLVVPLVADDEAVLVNVGWVPLATEFADAQRIVPAGTISIEGLLHPTELRPRFGREEPEGLLTVVNRIDVDRLQFQAAVPLMPFWLQLVSPDDPAAPPVPLPRPALDEGSHLSYAIQWFSFAGIAAVGVIALARRDVRRGSSASEIDQAPVG